MITFLGLNTHHGLKIKFQYISHENVFENPFMGALSDVFLSFT